MSNLPDAAMKISLKISSISDPADVVSAVSRKRSKATCHLTWIAISAVSDTADFGYFSNFFGNTENNRNHLTVRKNVQKNFLQFLSSHVLLYNFYYLPILIRGTNFCTSSKIIIYFLMILYKNDWGKLWSWKFYNYWKNVLFKIVEYSRNDGWR